MTSLNKNIQEKVIYDILTYNNRLYQERECLLYKNILQYKLSKSAVLRETT